MRRDPGGIVEAGATVAFERGGDVMIMLRNIAATLGSGLLIVYLTTLALEQVLLHH